MFQFLMIIQLRKQIDIIKLFLVLIFVDIVNGWIKLKELKLNIYYLKFIILNKYKRNFSKVFKWYFVNDVLRF